MINNLKSLLQNYSSIYPEEIVAKEKMLEFLDKNSLGSSFLNDTAGHFTASVFLLNKDKTKFLLMHHKKLNKWLQLGGHCKSTDILTEAIREAKEESGINEIEIVNDIVNSAPFAYKEQGAKPIRRATSNVVGKSKSIDYKIFDIDVHYIPKRPKEPAHYHYDIRFLLKTIDNDNFIKNNESHELKWFSFADYPRLDIKLERSVTRMIEKLGSVHLTVSN